MSSSVPTTLPNDLHACHTPHVYYFSLHVIHYWTSGPAAFVHTQFSFLQVLWVFYRVWGLIHFTHFVFFGSSPCYKTSRTAQLTMAEKNAEKVWRRRFGYEVADEMADCGLAAEQEGLAHACGPYESLKVETPVELSQQRRGLGYSYGEMCWRGQRLGTRDDDVTAQEGRTDYCPPKTCEIANKTFAEEDHSQPNKGIGSYGSRSSRKRREDPGGNQQRKQDGGGLARRGEDRPEVSSSDCPKTTARMVEQDRHFEKKSGRLGGAHFFVTTFRR